METENKLNRNLSIGSTINWWLTVLFFIASIVGTIVWNWKAIPIAFLVTLFIARFYGMIFIDPHLRRTKKHGD